MRGAPVCLQTPLDPSSVSGLIQPDKAEPAIPEPSTVDHRWPKPASAVQLLNAQVRIPRNPAELLNAPSALAPDRPSKITGRALFAREPDLGCSLVAADGAMLTTERTPKTLVLTGLTVVPTSRAARSTAVKRKPPGFRLGVEMAPQMSGLANTFSRESRRTRNVFSCVCHRYTCGFPDRPAGAPIMGVPF